MANFRVVICGGGIAAVEGLLHLRRLAGDSVDIELLAPGDELVYRPMAVREPFAFGRPRRYPLRRIAHDTGADWTKDALEWVDADARAVHTNQGRRVEYDALLIAVGARQVEPYKHVATFRDADADGTYHGIIQDIEGGYTRNLTFIQPVGPGLAAPALRAGAHDSGARREHGHPRSHAVARDPRAASPCRLRNGGQRRSS